MPQEKPKVEKKETTKKWVNIAKNLDYVFSEKGILMIKIDPKEEQGLSKSQKTVIIATAGRPKEINLPDGSSIFLNITAYKYPNPK